VVLQNRTPFPLCGAKPTLLECRVANCTDLPPRSSLPSLIFALILPELYPINVGVFGTLATSVIVAGLILDADHSGRTV
jgi:hypothetical protein